MKSKYSIVITIVFGIFLITLSGIYLLNKRKTPIKIGFIADFTTGGSDLAIQGRNGALLAINKINKSGGFKGRKFELITETNHNNKELCRAAVSSLLDKNVSLIVGPMLSSMASSVLDATKDQNILVISPGVSGNRYYNTDDNLILMKQSSVYDGRLLAEAVVSRGDKHVALAWTKENEEFTSSIIQGVREELIAKNIDIKYEYVIKDNDDYSLVAEQLALSGADGIVFSGQGYIIGSIIQHFRELNFSPNLYSEQWAKETSIKNIGGRATEGMILCELDHTLSAKNRSFNDNYTDKFSTEIKPVAYLSYRAILLFYDAVRGIGYNRSYIEYRDYIINMNKSHGIKEDISFTQNGDVMGRSKILYIIKDNEYDLYK